MSPSLRATRSIAALSFSETPWVLINGSRIRTSILLSISAFVRASASGKTISPFSSEATRSGWLRKLSTKSQPSICSRDIEVLQDRADAALYFICGVFPPICDAQPLRNWNIKQVHAGCHSDRLDKVEA